MIIELVKILKIEKEELDFSINFRQNGNGVKRWPFWS